MTPTDPTLPDGSPTPGAPDAPPVPPADPPAVPAAASGTPFAFGPSPAVVAVATAPAEPVAGTAERPLFLVRRLTAHGAVNGGAL